MICTYCGKMHDLPRPFCTWTCKENPLPRGLSPTPDMTQTERDRLVLSYLPMIRHITRKMKRVMWRYGDECDLFQEGIIGFLHAIRLFDPSFGVKFVTYAYTSVYRYVQHAVNRNSGLIHLPSNVRPAAMSDSADAAWDEAVRRAKSALRVKSIDKELPMSGRQQRAKTVRDFLAAPPAQRPSFERDEIDALNANLRKLRERDQLILRLRNGFEGPEYTLEEIGRRLKVSRERVRQLEEKAMVALSRLFFPEMETGQYLAKRMLRAMQVQREQEARRRVVQSVMTGWSVRRRLQSERLRELLKEAS